MTSAAIAPRAETAFDVPIRPAALAQVWTGPGKPHECIAVPGVALDRGEVLVAVELATICGSDVHTVSGHRETQLPRFWGMSMLAALSRSGQTAFEVLTGRPCESATASCGRCLPRASGAIDAAKGYRKSVASC